MFDEYKNHDIAVYGGYLNDNQKVLESASGGIATALTEYVIRQGGYVAGVTYSDDFYKAEYTIIHNLADIRKLKGSKYIECDKNSIYADVKNLIAAGEKVLFFGLPCAVAALYKFIGSRPENLWTCELVCYGPTSQKIHQEYTTYLENKFQSKIVDFSVRHKKEGWTPPYLYAKFQNGEIFEKPFYETEYGYAFSVFGRESCYHCMFRGNNRQGDIMVGDFLGATKADPFWNENGVSVIFAETNHGHELLQKIPDINLFPTTFEKAVEHNPMIIQSKIRMKNREKFSNLLSENGLFYAAKHSPSENRELLN